MPITWKNVSDSGASNAAVGARLFEQSREAMNDGFGGLRDLLRQNQTTDLANWDQVKENNTNTALDKLRQYTTPEAYAAAQAAGELNVDPAYGAQVDARAVRDAAEARLGILQDAATKTQGYQDLQTEVKARPLLDQYYALKTPEERAAYRAKYDLGLNEGQLADAEQTQQLALNKDSREVQELGLRQQQRSEERQSWQIRNKEELRMEAYNTSLRNGERLAQEAAAAEQARDEANRARVAELADRLGLPVVEGVPDVLNYTPAQKNMLQEAVDYNQIKLTTPDQNAEALRAKLKGLGITSADQDNLLNTYSSNVDRGPLLSPEYKAQREQAAALAGTTADAAAARITTERTKIAADNPLIAKTGDEAFAERTKVIEAVKAVENVAERDRLLEPVTRTLNGGIKINGVHYDVTPAMANMALSTALNVDDGWFTDDKGPAYEKALRSLVLSDDYAKWSEEALVTYPGLELKLLSLTNGKAGLQKEAQAKFDLSSGRNALTINNLASELYK